MTAKEYLSQARKLNVLISSKIDFVEKLKLLAFNVSSCKENSKHTNKDQGSIRCVEKIDEMQIEINADIDKYIDICTKIRSYVEQIKSRTEQIILTERYLNNKSWEEIAELLHYSKQHIFRLHGKALNDFEIILKDESKCD